jgi:two-component system chemotaxis response regulator CheY
MSRKILIVDDSQTARRQLSNTLTDLDLSVVEAIDGRDGIEKIHENPDVKMIIADFNMPQLNGIEMMMTIRRDDRFKTIPCLILTSIGQGNLELINAAKEAGIMGWMIKPPKKEQLELVFKKLNI